jgi:LacI family transcriptional regulator
MSTRPPTLQDIARAAGVGKATVSLALRDDPRLRPATRARIQQVASEMGYHANATVSALMAQLRASRTPKYQATLGLVNASTERDTLRNFSTFRDWVNGCLHRATQLGYGLDDFWLREPGIPPGRLATILEARGIRGLVIAGVGDRNAMPAEFEAVWTRFACVVIGLRTTRPALHCATNDQFATAFQAVEQALQLGYRRPGLVVQGEIDANVEYRFSAGFGAALKTLRKVPRLPVCDFDRRKPAAFTAWFEKNRPDVIVCLHHELAAWLAAMRVKVPDDVGLIHLDRTAEMEGWAGMNQSNEMVGIAAIDMIVGQIHRSETGIPAFPRAMMVESAWVAGETVRRQHSP